MKWYLGMTMYAVGSNRDYGRGYNMVCAALLPEWTYQAGNDCLTCSGTRGCSSVYGVTGKARNNDNSRYVVNDDMNERERLTNG